MVLATYNSKQGYDFNSSVGYVVHINNCGVEGDIALSKHCETTLNFVLRCETSHYERLVFKRQYTGINSPSLS